MKEKINYFMDRLGSVYIYVILVGFILYLGYNLFMYQYEYIQAKRDFYMNYKR